MTEFENDDFKPTCMRPLKFMFSKKATQTDKNITIDLTLTTWCQIISGLMYFLGWSLDMTSTCLEHKTRIA